MLTYEIKLFKNMDMMLDDVFSGVNRPWPLRRCWDTEMSPSTQRAGLAGPRRSSSNRSQGVHQNLNTDIYVSDQIKILK